MAYSRAFVEIKLKIRLRCIKLCIDASLIIIEILSRLSRVQLKCIRERLYMIYKNMYACIINIYVPHEVKNLRASAKRTSQIM